VHGYIGIGFSLSYQKTPVKSDGSLRTPCLNIGSRTVALEFRIVTKVKHRRDVSVTEGEMKDYIMVHDDVWRYRCANIGANSAVCRPRAQHVPLSRCSDGDDCKFSSSFLTSLAFKKTNLVALSRPWFLKAKSQASSQCSFHWQPTEVR
jgi:hypothetical protein